MKSAYFGHRMLSNRNYCYPDGTINQQEYLSFLLSLNVVIGVNIYYPMKKVFWCRWLGLPPRRT